MSWDVRILFSEILIHTYNVFCSYLPSFWILTCHFPKLWSIYQDHTPEIKTLAAITVRPQRGGGSWTPLLHARMSTGLIFCRTCAGSHGSCEFMSIMRLSCSEDVISYQPPLPTVFSSYSLLWWSLSLGVCEIYSLWVRTQQALPLYTLTSCKCLVLPSFHCKHKLLCWWLRAAFIKGDED